MKTSLAIFFCFVLVRSSAQEQPLSLADTQFVHGEWKFKTDPNANGEMLGWFSDSFNPHGWDSMPVPGNWDLRNEYANYTGVAWYRKVIPANVAWRDKLIRLLFDGVNFESKVWVNGKLVGTNNVGYLPFGFDVSSHWNHDRPNTIVVSCDNTYRLGAVWNWGGIRRPVRLVATANAYISAQYITPVVDLDKKTASVAIRVVGRNDGPEAATLSGEILLSADNGFRRKLPFSIRLNAGKSEEIILRTTLKKDEVHLWTCDDPYLYHSQVKVTSDGSIVPAVTNRFGLRKVEIDNKNYTVKLNGEPVRMLGFNLVPDDRTTGSTLPAWRIRQDIDMMKSLGANMSRLTHLPMPAEMFDYLDEKGIMVFPEIPLWGLHQLVNKDIPTAKEWLFRLTDNYYNHPSIIGWCVGNEIGESMGVMEYVEDAIRYVKSIDSTRLGVMVSHTAQRPRDPVQYSDLGLVNGYGVGIGARADRIHTMHPQKTLFYSEFGYGQLEEDLDGDVDAKGMMDSIRNKPYLVGASLWTFNDYRSSFLGTKEFSQNRPWGIVDVFRQKKRAWYAFRREYAPIRSLDLAVTDTSSGFAANIRIAPRKLLDLPAYPVKDYTLLWQAFNDSNNIIDGGFTRLPVIRPGDADLQQAIKTSNVKDIAYLRIDILTPGNYSVYDTVVHFKVPPPPVVISAIGIRSRQNDTAANSGAIRVVFDKKEDKTSYKLKWGVDDLASETAATFNRYADISKLPFGKTYKVAAVAINSKGESVVSETKTVTVGTDYAPPLIYYTEPADKGFYVGYATDEDDYVFRIQYTLTKGDYRGAKTIQSATRGVMFVPGLVNGKQYYFRMSRAKHTNYSTGWTDEYSVTPDGDQPPDAPVLQGVLRSGAEAIVIFQPVKKAIAYTVEYRLTGTGVWSKIIVNANDLRHIRVGSLQRKPYEFRLAVDNANGRSAFTTSVTR